MKPTKAQLDGTLLRDQWWPMAAVGTSHPAEDPYFFHWGGMPRRRTQGRGPSPTPPLRDKGLCARCGEPAGLLRDRTVTPSAACQQAEAKGTTVARLRRGSGAPPATPTASPTAKPADARTGGSDIAPCYATSPGVWLISGAALTPEL